MTTKWQIENDSIQSETHILNQYLEQVRSLHLATDKRIVEMDAGNQQLLEKLLSGEGIGWKTTGCQRGYQLSGDKSETLRQ